MGIEIRRNENNTFDFTFKPTGVPADLNIFSEKDDGHSEKSLRDQLQKISKENGLKGPAKPENPKFKCGTEPQQSIWSSPLFWILLFVGVVLGIVGGYFAYLVCC